MTKKFLSVVCALVMSLQLCSCSENTVENSDTEITAASTASESESVTRTEIATQQETETTVAEPQMPEEEVSITFDEQVTDIPYYNVLDTGELNCRNLQLQAFTGSDLFAIHSADEKTMEIYRFNTESGEKKLVGSCEWSVMYGFLSTVIGERYFVIMPSDSDMKFLTSSLYVYDMENDEFYTADTFAARNMVQYLVNIGSDKAVYYYYDAETADWIIKEYDFTLKKSREVYRNSSEEDKKFSPVGLTYNGENLVLAVQYYNEEFVTETKFIEIDMQGNEVNEHILSDFPIEIIYGLNFDGRYYNVCGNKHRASGEFSSMLIELGDGGFDVVLPLSANLTVPTNISNNRKSPNSIACSKENDFAVIDTETNHMSYFNVYVPDFTVVNSSVSNENNDLAVIKSDEDYENYKLVVADGSAVCGGLTEFIMPEHEPLQNYDSVKIEWDNDELTALLNEAEHIHTQFFQNVYSRYFKTPPEYCDEYYKTGVTYESFKAVLKNYFTDEFTEYLLSGEDEYLTIYSEHDGELWYIEKSEGSNPSFNSVTFSIAEQTNDKIVIKVVSRFWHEDEPNIESFRDFYFDVVMTENGWRFDSFEDYHNNLVPDGNGGFIPLETHIIEAD